MVSYEINYSQYLLQNNIKINSYEKMAEQFKHCRFPTTQNTQTTYICLKNEICCDNGCCLTSFRKMAQFWYFCLILIFGSALYLACRHYYGRVLILVFICAAFMACMHYYRKLREDREERLYQRNNRQQHIMSERLRFNHRGMHRRPEDYPLSYPIDEDAPVDVHNDYEHPDNNHRNYSVIEPFERPETPEMNDLLLEQLLVSYRNSRSNTYLTNLPPDYSTVEKDSIYTEPPPIYSVACKLLEQSQHDDPKQDTSEIAPALSEIGSGTPPVSILPSNETPPISATVTEAGVEVATVDYIPPAQIVLFNEDSENSEATTGN